MTGEWPVGGKLRGKIADGDIDALEHIGAAQLPSPPAWIGPHGPRPGGPDAG